MNDFLGQIILCVRHYNENLLLVRYFQRLNCIWLSTDKFICEFNNFYWDKNYYTLLEFHKNKFIYVSHISREKLIKNMTIRYKKVIFVDEFLKMSKAVLITKK